MPKAIRSPRAPQPLGPYSQAILDEATGLVFCAGQIGLDPANGELAAGGIEPEFRQALANVRAVLEAASCSLEDVLRVTIYLADIAEFSRVNALYSEAFREPYPARSTVQAAALPKHARVEVEVTARRRS